MSSVEYNMYYIAGRIDAEEHLTQVRDELYRQTGASIEDYTKRTPHLTFVNRIKLPVHNEPKVHSELDEFNPTGIPVKITGICVWPSIDKPRYVSLSVESPIQQYQETFQDIIYNESGEILTEPPQPHITLFKCDNPYNVSERMKEHLRELQEKEFNIHTHIPYIDLLDDAIKQEIEQTQTEKDSQFNKIVTYND